MPKLIVTSSWDDGNIADLRLSRLLLDCGMRATFYVPLAFEDRPAGIYSHLHTLARNGFEIGAHGVTHRPLSSLPILQVRSELRDSKAALEQALGRGIQTFCYPMGRYNAAVLEEVAQAGYMGARTTRMFCSDIRSPFEMPTTVQAYPHPARNYLKNLLRGRNFAALRKFACAAIAASGWVELGKMLFDDALKSGGMWHLYGHSWEIDQLNLWRPVQELLTYVSGRPEVRYLTNGEVIAAWNSEQEAGLEDRICA